MKETKESVDQKGINPYELLAAYLGLTRVKSYQRLRNYVDGEMSYEDIPYVRFVDVDGVEYIVTRLGFKPTIEHNWMTEFSILQVDFQLANMKAKEKEEKLSAEVDKGKLAIKKLETDLSEYRESARLKLEEQRDENAKLKTKLSETQRLLNIVESKAMKVKGPDPALQRELQLAKNREQKYLQQIGILEQQLVNARASNFAISSRPGKKKLHEGKKKRY